MRTSRDRISAASDELVRMINSRNANIQHLVTLWETRRKERDSQQSGTDEHYKLSIQCSTLYEALDILGESVTL